MRVPRPLGAPSSLSALDSLSRCPYAHASLMRQATSPIDLAKGVHARPQGLRWDASRHALV
eukprot:446528-Pyramimonas_sp.AAC.1